MINSFFSIFSIIEERKENAILVEYETWKKYKWLIKFLVFTNKRYISCQIFRKKYKIYNNFVVVALKFSGKNVKRRCSGYAKTYINNSKRAKCIYCETHLSENNATTDHIIPISRGGNNSKVNLVVVCSKCNSERGSMDFLKFLRIKNKKVINFI